MNKKMFIIIVVLISIPIVLVISLNISIFEFASGQVDSWIMFWGSYIGAIIGASIVYFVSKIQIEENGKAQLALIKKESELASKRELEQYYFKIRLDKIMEGLELLKACQDKIIDLYNIFVEYLTLSEIIDNRLDEVDVDRRRDLITKVNQLKNDKKAAIDSVNHEFYQLSILTNFLTEIISHNVKLNTSFDELTKELDDAFGDSKSYVKYFDLVNVGSTKSITPNLVDVNSSLEVMVEIILPLLHEQLNKVR